ncbi:MAG: oligosaccharide flippase family protein [Bacteroidota bacterium]
MPASEPSPRRSPVTRWLDRRGTHTRDLLSGASVAFAAKVVGAGAGFALSVLVAQLLGAEGTGDFFLALGMLSVVATVGRFGLDQAVVRFVAAEASEDAWGRVRSVAQTSIKVAGGLLLLCALSLGLGAEWLATVVFGREELAPVFRAVAWGVVPMGLAWVYAALLRGRRDIAASQTVQAVLSQLIALPLLWGLHATGRLTVEHAVLAYAVATGGTLLAGVLWWHRAMPSEAASRFPARELLSTSAPLFGVALMGILTQWLPVLLLGALATSAETGVFAIAMRVVSLAGLVLMAINVMAAPQFAALYHQGDGTELSSLVRQTSLYTTVLAIPILIALLAMPRFVLGLFGESFVVGVPVLRILAIGYTVNLVTGAVGTLLVMSGRERAMQSVTLFSTGLLATGCVVLIPPYGMLGAAIAVSAALAVQNSIAAWWVWRTFRINPLFFLPTPTPRLD